MNNTLAYLVRISYNGWRQYYFACEKEDGGGRAAAVMS